MGTIFILFVLIVALTELLGLRKENEEKDQSITDYIKNNKALERENDDQSVLYANNLLDLQMDNSNCREIIKVQINTIIAYKGANTKHKATIEKMKDEEFTNWEFINYQSTLLDDRATEIINSNTKIDESKVVCEALLKLAKKGNMEEAKAIVKSYYKM